MKNRRGLVGQRRVGDIVEVPLPDGSYGYGQVLTEPLIAFFGLRSAQTPTLEEIVSSDVLFAIWVSKAIECDWSVVGHVEVSPLISQFPPFFKKDPLTGDYSITFDGGDELPATLKEVELLERAAVWQPNHVADRLLDHFEGRTSRWVESLKP